MWKSRCPPKKFYYINHRTVFCCEVIWSRLQFTGLPTWFFKWTNPVIFLFIFVLFKHKFYIKTLVFSRIWTRIVGSEGKHARRWPLDHRHGQVAKWSYLQDFSSPIIYKKMALLGMVTFCKEIVFQYSISGHFYRI